MKEENLSVASPGEEDDHQSLLSQLSSHDDDVTSTILVGVGARHPIKKPPDGLYSHNDDVTGPIVMGVGARHPINKPLVGLSSCSAKTKHKHPTYNLVGLTGWWRRLEKEGEMESKKRDKEGAKIAVKIANKRQEKEEKASFIKKYFPTFEESPGGTDRLRARTPMRRKDIGTISQLELSGGKRKTSENMYEQKDLTADFRKQLKFWVGADMPINSTKMKYNLGCSDSAGPSDRTAETSDNQTGGGFGGGENEGKCTSI
jgi:hypothetical protein